MCEKQFQSFPNRHNNLSTSFHRLCFLSRPLDNGLVVRKTGSPLSANVKIIFSAILSHPPCGLSSLIEDRFFSERRPRHDHCPTPNLLALWETRLAFDSNSTLLSIDPHEMSLNIDMKIFLPVKFSGVSFNLNNKLLTSSLSCNVLYPGTTFHSNSSGSPSILSNFSVLLRFFKHSNLCSQAAFDWVCSCILPRHNTESEKT